MYKQTCGPDKSFQGTVQRLSDGAFIPFDPANSDYQRFKVDITEGAELLDADGNVMTAEQVQDFLETLP